MRGAWVGVLVLLLRGPSAGAQSPEEPCRQITETAVAELADELGLAADQEAWLLSRVRQGRLREPEDLEGMPGLGPELRETLSASLCWSSPWTGMVEAAVREAQGTSLRDARLTLARGMWAGTGRVRSSGDATTLRGAVSARRAGWEVHAGTLRARRGLGLALVSPGSEPRGHAPVRESRSGWRPTLSTGDGILRGAAVEGAGRSWRAGGAVLSSRGAGGEAAPPLLSGEGALCWRGTWFGVFWAGGGASPAVGTRLRSELPGGTWCLEWVHAGGGDAQGASWHFAEGSLRVRVSLLRWGEGYRISSIPWYRTPRGSDRTSFRGEGRWSSGPGRYLRLAWDTGHTEGIGDTWPERRDWLEVEVGERIRPRLGCRVLWRRQVQGPYGETSEPSASTVRLTRGEIAYGGPLWRGALDLREMENEGGRSRMTTVRLGRTGRWRWEARVALVSREPGTPLLWWYRRRAGGQYGWDAVSTGTWAGAWAGWQGGALRLEASLDRRGESWDFALGVGWGVGR